MANEVAKVQRFTIDQVAERLAVSPRQVRKLIETGELKALNVAANRNARRKRYVVDLDDLEKFENARKTGAPQKQPRQRRQTKKYDFPVYVDI